MRKAPFSTPRGNKSGGNKSESGWKSNERRNSRGYGDRNNYFHVYPSNSSPEVGTGDFIPFNSTPPSHYDKNKSPSGYFYRNSTPTAHYDRSRQGNFSGGRGGRNRSFGGSPGFYSDNRSPRGNSHSFSPYNNRRGSYRDHKSELAAMRSKPISEIIDLSLILENPWRKLMSSLSNYTQQDEKNESNVSINSGTIESSLQDSILEDNQENDNSSEEKSLKSDD